jgi:hypothetical protein
MFGLFSRPRIRATSALVLAVLRVPDAKVPAAVVEAPALVSAAVLRQPAARSAPTAQLVRYADLADAVYTSRVPAGWRADWVVDLSATSGFKGVVYVSADGRQAVLVFRGTDLRGGTYLSTADMVTDAAQAAGAVPPQFAQAKWMATWARWYYGGRLAIVGHSKGGAEATYAGLSTGTHTVAFNAAGLGRGALAELRHQGKLSAANTALVENYNVTGDPLSSYVNVLLGTPQTGRQFWLTPAYPAGPLALHSAAAVLDALRRDLAADVA